MLTPKRAASAIVLVAIMLAPTFLALSAQIPGPNVNVVSIDPYLQKQNEPSLAVSTLNPCHLQMGGNDYRTVNIPGVSGDQELFDSWVGVYQSTDCGQTWLAGLMPGFPQDQTPEGLVSPAKGFSAAADSVQKAGLGGFIANSFIVFDRGTNLGKLLLARFHDTNNTQVTASTVTNIDPLLVPHNQWPIKYISPTLTVDGGTAQFLDKPNIATAKGTGTCNLDGRIVPATVVHIVWTVFLNNSPPGGNVVNRVNYARSSDCGATLDSSATKLSESVKRSQGAIPIVHPVTGEVYVVWRTIEADDPTQGNIMFVKSVGGGKSFTSPAPIPTFAGMSFFHQNTTPTTFRTIAFPTAAFDHNGRLHVLAAVRTNNAVKSARITETTTLDGVTWTAPTQIAPSSTPEHQIMPAVDYSSGKLRAAWYDLVDDASGVFEELVDDSHVLTVAGPHVRHTIDVRGAEGVFATNGSVTWNTFGVIQLPGLTPKISQYAAGQEPGSALQLLQWHRPNLDLYCGGHCPFIGDYLDTGGLGFVPLPTPQSEAGTGPPNWVVNGPATAANFSQDFHAAWTDNRDAIVDSVIGDPSGTVLYSAPIAGCDPALTKTRNANIYTSRMTPGLSLLLPVNTEPSNQIQRTFPFMITNGTTLQRTVNISIQNQPPGGGTASFTQVGTVTNIQAILPPKSSASRTVFVSSTTKYPPIRIFAAENVPNPTLTAGAVINPDSTNLDPQGPSASTETHDVAIGNPDIHTPDMENPDLENPDLENPDLENPDLENPDLENPDLENPDLENPDLENPDMENPSLFDGVVTDTSYTLTNVGTDLSAYQVDLDVDGKKLDEYFYQLIARRVNKKPTANGCQQAHTWQNQVLFNITTPDVSFAGFTDSNDPAAKNATFMLFPGESIRLTLRAWDKDAKNNGISGPKDPKLQRFCAFADGDAGCPQSNQNNTITVKIRPQAANTGAQAPTVVTFVQQ
jgi:hypothetical protein